MPPTKCVMCKSRNAKVMLSIQDRKSSITNPAFCSLTCAARWACIQLNNEKHLCPVTNQWEFDMDGCSKCKQD